MNKHDLARVIAARTGQSIMGTEATLDAMFEGITNTLRNGEDVGIRGFGRFRIKERPERDGRNPQTGETIRIAASRIVKFKQSSDLV